ncbi:hypothetical protein BCR32DRAFT_279760 [Anaeromyces robustus]|uniref:Uncharacterized protein n=1 Tax=Anaeromyces robustus TaxID=1754192 RepID=A0A1Y1X6D3_9FUNG|nr:hypothetical protein BCR32DRAFT_279760 [Anaeromyces robustus]|eukprot:ORX81353.1 hypothetical protein BCR32DRAFT_279760 [Anaeromyces robustus]
MNSDKSIKAKAYKINNFENSRNYLKFNLEFPEYSKGFKWILRARFAKAAKMINNSCFPNCCSCCFHCDKNMVLMIEITIVHTKRNGECLFKCQIESGTYSKSPFLLRSVALLNDIMPVVCKRQHILFNKFKTNFSRNVNADNTVRQPSKTNADPITDPSGIG